MRQFRATYGAQPPSAWPFLARNTAHRRLARAVLAPVDKDLAGTSTAFHVADDQVGEFGLKGLGELSYERTDIVGVVFAIETCIEVNAFAAARDGMCLQPGLSEEFAGVLGDLRAFTQPRTRAWIEIEHESVRIVRRAVGIAAPLWHVDLQSGNLAEPGQGGDVVHQGVVVRVIDVFDGDALQPLWCGVTQVLLEEEVPRLPVHSDAVDPTFARRRTIACMTDEVRRDLGVVADDIGFCRPGRRVEHLIEVGQVEAMAVDCDGFGSRILARHHLRSGQRTG